MLVEELSPVYTKWEALGRALGVSQEHLEAIHTHPGDCLREMLRMWFPSSYDQYWSDIVDALRSIGEDSLCSELKVKYGELLSTESSMFGQVYEGLDVKMIVQLPLQSLRNLQSIRLCYYLCWNPGHIV